MRSAIPKAMIFAMLCVSPPVLAQSYNHSTDQSQSSYGRSDRDDSHQFSGYSDRNDSNQQGYSGSSYRDRTNEGSRADYSQRGSYDRDSDRHRGYARNGYDRYGHRYLSTRAYRWGEHCWTRWWHHRRIRQCS